MPHLQNIAFPTKSRMYDKVMYDNALKHNNI